MVAPIELSILDLETDLNNFGLLLNSETTSKGEFSLGGTLLLLLLLLLFIALLAETELLLSILLFLFDRVTELPFGLLFLLAFKAFSFRLESV
jgi:hypothetical protein